MKIKKGDNVQIMTGKDRGRQAKVDAIWVKKEAAMLSGLNQYKKHRKPQTGGAQGEIVSLSRPIKTANLALICPKCKQLTRAGYKKTDDKKVRICKKCGADL